MTLAGSFSNESVAVPVIRFPLAQEGQRMSIVDDLVENLVERNGLRLTGALAIRLIPGGISINGTLKSTLRDQKKNRDLLNVNVPVDARVKIDDIAIPLPNIP